MIYVQLPVGSVEDKEKVVHLYDSNLLNLLKVISGLYVTVNCFVCDCLVYKNERMPNRKGSEF